MRAPTRAAVAAGVIVVLAAAPIQPAATASNRIQRPAATLAVDFNSRAAHSNALGFMHGGLRRMPQRLALRVENLAAGLLPGIWRGVPQAWSLEPSIVRAVGASPVIQLGDIWGLPGHWPAVWPDQDPAAYGRWVEARASNIKAWFPHGTIWVDVWNEPDNPAYWPVGRDPKLLGYMSAFRVAERILRRSLGERVRVIGPSTAGNASLWTERLVRYCAARGCRVDAIAWHANFQSGSMMAGLGNAIRKIRSAAAADPGWRKVVRRPMDFLVTEYVSAARRSAPGSLLAYWNQIEKGGARGSFSIWRSGGQADGLLDSLLDAEGRPRGSWWAARAYAVGRSGRVHATGGNPFWPILATRKGLSGGREILVGSWSSRGGTVAIRVRGLRSGTTRVRTTVFRPSRSPWQGSDASPRWSQVGRLRVVRGAGTLRIAVPGDTAVAVAIG